MSTQWLTAFARNYVSGGTSGTSGGENPAPPPSPTPAVCETNQAYMPFWHNSAPWGTSNGDANMENYMVSDFNVVSTINNWSDVTGNGAMAWISIGLANNYATSDVYVGTDYWIRMARYNGDGTLQNDPSVAGGSSAPNVLFLEELDSAGVKTGNSITFQCIEDGTYVPGTTVPGPSLEFYFKARVTGQSGFGLTQANFNGNSWYSISTTGEFCVTWSSTTPITTCGPVTSLTATNVHTTDFAYPGETVTGGGSSSPVGGGGGGGAFGG